MHFAFFALVLVIVFWINRAVLLFDRLIGDGQTALVFLEFTLLSLPRLMTTVVPIATFAGAVYVTNRLNNESELTAMLSIGSGPWRIARPVIAYGAVTGVLMAVLMNILVPAAQERLSQREIEVSQNITARLLSEGAFLSPSKSMIFYTQTIDETGILKNVFVSDRRDPDRSVTYSAQEAYLVREGDGFTLIMVDGLAQTFDAATNRLSATTFQDFSFNISALITREKNPLASVQFLMTWELFAALSNDEVQKIFSAGSLVEELHGRFAQPLFCIAAALVGVSTLLIGGYSRFGVWREVILAFALLLVIDGLRGTLIDQVLGNARLWPILYIPAFVGLSLGALMLWIASRPSLLRRRRKAPQESVS